MSLILVMGVEPKQFHSENAVAVKVGGLSRGNNLSNWVRGHYQCGYMRLFYILFGRGSVGQNGVKSRRAILVIRRGKRFK